MNVDKHTNILSKKTKNKITLPLQHEIFPHVGIKFHFLD